MKTNLSLTAKKFLDNVHALIIVLSIEGDIEFVNQYTANLLGYNRETMIGKNWFDHFIPGEQRTDLKKGFKTFLNKRENKSNTNYVETKEGELHLIEWYSTYIQDKQGNVIGSFSSGEDITEKHILKLYLADQQSRHKIERLNSIIEAAERERQYLAYELHDGVNQILTTCKLLLESEINSGASPNVHRTYHYIQEVINTLRELSHELNPAELGNEGLYQSALELIERINATGKIRVVTDIKGTKHLKDLCRSVSLSLFRIMQEALTNIIKHAGAQHAHISLMASPNAIDLEILDNGKGFDRNEKKLGLGLKTIYTRAEAAGGKAHIMTSLGDGTSLSIHIPITKKGSEMSEH